MTLMGFRLLSPHNRVMTFAEAFQLVTSTPEVVEGFHHGHPDFRVDGKIFGSGFPDKGCIVLRLPPGMGALAVEGRPGRRLVSQSGGAEWVEFKEESIPESELRELLAAAMDFRR